MRGGRLYRAQQHYIGKSLGLKGNQIWKNFWAPWRSGAFSTPCYPHVAGIQARKKEKVRIVGLDARATEKTGTANDRPPLHH